MPRGRPRIPDAEKVVPLRLTVPPDVDRELRAVAELSGRKVSAEATDAIREHCRRKLGRRRADLVPPRARPDRARRTMPD